ncbi:PLD nuclease N-terminal domain-containing protein [Saccharopolyspora sp. NFXS83]|uniref:PLD nuclease N-terminal domain-containing protein n=1 Tax=Saccharopolyspora sp. NFXS83 TaxID=2993560 RepID=UPI00224B00CF|nr:PLD nuclease N-terminal domain-containing protein [Saccharopolyspora sp. NFXS83]MCX2733798.1 PLD nuclease N-terminal domain-containing protein [Saccharopolyspora sp. NFXS83]
MKSLIAQHSALAASTGEQVGAWVLTGGVLAVVAAFAVLFIAALISILGSGLSGGMKLVWIVLAFLAPFLGSLLWFAVGRPDARKRFAN